MKVLAEAVMDMLSHRHPDYPPNDVVDRQIAVRRQRLNALELRNEVVAQQAEMLEATLDGADSAQ